MIPLRQTHIQHIKFNMGNCRPTNKMPFPSNLRSRSALNHFRPTEDFNARATPPLWTQSLLSNLASKEKRMKGKMLYSPIDMNAAFKQRLKKKKWNESHVSYWVTRTRRTRCSPGSDRDSALTRLTPAKLVPEITPLARRSR